MCGMVPKISSMVRLKMSGMVPKICGVLPKMCGIVAKM